jgi:virulence-associated protein VagC
MTATMSIPYASLESSVLELPVEARCQLTHVLIRSIDEKIVIEPEREERWVDLAEKVNVAINEGRMETVDAFEAIAKMRSNLA